MSDPYVVDSESIITRNRARVIAREARQLGARQVDLSSVRFISRSVADELVHQSDEHGLIYTRLSPEVEQMMSAVGGQNSAIP